MIRTLNVMLAAAVVVAAFVIYSLEHSIRSTEREIARVDAGIAKEKEAMKLLEVHWSNLTRPNRIDDVAAKQLELGPANPDQFTTPQGVQGKLQPLSPTIAGGDQDPLGQFIRGMDGTGGSQ